MTELRVCVCGEPFVCRKPRAAMGKREHPLMEFQDRVLTCVDCGTDFLFTAGEQAFFYAKQFANPPKRCRACKAKRVTEWGLAPPVTRVPARVETHVNCSRCGKETTVPFKPTQGRPVFCRDCFRDRQTSASA